VYARAVDSSRTYRSWYEPSSRIRSVALHEATLRRCQSPCLSQLWKTWHKSMPCLGSELRGVLGGYGANIQARVGFRPHQQRPGIQLEQLPVDNTKKQHSKPPYEQENQHSVWGDDSRSTCGINRNRCDDNLLPNSPQLANRIVVCDTGCAKRVYDIRNCGPRHRFVVWSDRKGRIVSNCVQAISRDILCFAMQTLRCCSIVAHVHDEVIIEADPSMSLKAVCEQMGRTPPWAKGLVLRADGFECDFYQKD